MEPKIIVIAGPTCSGKTSLSLLLAEKLNVEIISADSRQIFKYLDIGTAKPSKQNLEKVKHHFIDVLEPDENYNVSRFENEASSIKKIILSKNKVPLVVGGSGLYIRALIDGIFDEVDIDQDYRNELLEQKKSFGNEFLYSELIKVDPESAAKMLPQNWKRIIRALEVFHLTGKPIGLHQKGHNRQTDFKFLQFGLNWERSILYENIELRVDEMIELGLVEETKGILEKGFDRNLNALNTVGYKEIISFLDGNINIERAVELIKRNTRRFAKRQLTWFRSDKRITWLNIDNTRQSDSSKYKQTNLKKDLENIADEIIRREELG
ncbi:MAG: tRNA (adenosine(37)-N6)-dimethylallyltransferase MiaA [Ignavibacteriaceae bacterium]